MALPQPDALSQPDALRAPDAPVRPRFCRRLKSVAVVPLLLGVVAAASLSLSLSAHGAAPVATIPRVLPAADEGGQRTGAAEEAHVGNHGVQPLPAFKLRRLLATEGNESAAEEKTPSLHSRASMYHYERARQPLWADHSDIASSLHPTIIGLGVQKSGTTALHYFLEHLSGIRTGRLKEEHFFDQHSISQHGPNNANVTTKDVRAQYLRYLRGWPRARQVTRCSRATMRCHLTQGGLEDATIEITPSYIADRRVPWIMHEILPHATEVKLLLILREPVARTLSGFFQVCKTCGERRMRRVLPRELQLLRKCYAATAGFGAGYGTGMAKAPTAGACATGHEQMARMHACVHADVEKDNKPWFGQFTRMSAPAAERFHKNPARGSDPYQGVIFRGIYVDSIKNYLCAGFRPEQFLIMTTSELHADMEAAVDRLARFVGKKLTPKVRGLFHAEGYRKNSKSSGHRLPSAFDKELQDFFRPYNEALLELLMNNSFDINAKYLVEEFMQY